jgi:hypothetical protein
MSDKSSSAASGGIGFPGLLTIVFVIAKITGYISWSWWAVFSPIWVSALLAFAVLAVIFVGMVLVEVLR